MNEFERFGTGRTLEQYKREELEALDQYEHESDAELERKRLVFLSLRLRAEERSLSPQGDPEGLFEFNKQRYDKLSAIIRRREEKKAAYVKASLWISVLALVLSLIALFK